MVTCISKCFLDYVYWFLRLPQEHTTLGTECNKDLSTIISKEFVQSFRSSCGTACDYFKSPQLSSSFSMLWIKNEMYDWRRASRESDNLLRKGELQGISNTWADSSWPFQWQHWGAGVPTISYPSGLQRAIGKCWVSTFWFRIWEVSLWERCLPPYIQRTESLCFIKDGGWCYTSIFESLRIFESSSGLCSSKELQFYIHLFSLGIKIPNCHVRTLS